MLYPNPCYIVKLVLSGHSKRLPKLVFKTDYCLMQVKSITDGAYSCSILSTFIKLPFIIKIFVLSIFEWPLKTGFTVKKVCYKRTALYSLFIVDGRWGQWGQWASCTHSCGGGTRNRTRQCNSPAPDHGGLFCVGTDAQVDYCNNERCPGK